MGQSEQHDIMKLTRRIESLEAKVYGGNKKVAVYAPELWMKEKIIKILGLNLEFKTIQHFTSEYVSMDHNFLGFEDEEVKVNNYKIIYFKDFCKQHGISDKPDYMRKENRIVKVAIWNHNKFIGYASTLGVWGDVWQPATEKEYLGQESEKEPELKLNEEWRGWQKDPLTGFLENYEYSRGFTYGAAAMQKAIYDRACEIYSNSPRSWQSCCADAINEAMNGDLKPPKQ